MADYSQYTYYRMLEYIESMSSQQKVDNHIDYILSMRSATSIEQIIKTYNNTYQFLARLSYGKKNVPRDWYKPENWGESKEYLVEELNELFNESLLNWFNRQEKKTKENALICISNLRNGNNTEDIQNKILSIKKPKPDKGLDNLIKIRNQQYSVRKEIEKRPFNHYLIMNNFRSCSRYLAAHKHIFDIAEIAFGKQNGIKFDNMIEEYKKEIEDEKRGNERKVKSEINSLMNSNTMNAICDVALQFLLSLPFAFFGGIIGNMGKKRK